MSVSEAWSALKAARSILAENLEDVPFRLRHSHLIRREEAAAQVASLHAALGDLLIPKLVVGAVAEGDPAAVALVADFVGANAGVVADAGALWRILAAKVAPSMGNEHLFGVNQHALAMQQLAETARAVGFATVPVLAYQPGRAAPGPELEAYLRGRVRAEVGDDLQRACLRHQIVGAVAIFDEPPAGRVPVLVVGASSEEWPGIESMFARLELCEFPIGFQVDEQSVTVAFKGSVAK